MLLLLFNLPMCLDCCTEQAMAIQRIESIPERTSARGDRERNLTGERTRDSKNERAWNERETKRPRETQHDSLNCREIARDRERERELEREKERERERDRERKRERKQENARERNRQGDRERHLENCQCLNTRICQYNKLEFS